MFIVSGIDLVASQCRAGIVGSFPALNARSSIELDEWLCELRERLGCLSETSIAVNLIVHKTNKRLEADLQIIEKHKIPLVITSLGAISDVNLAVHRWGGCVLHDVTSNYFAKKAIEKGADGLIAVAAGAGGHAGTQSPFALMQDIRAWFDGPIALSGCIASGRSIFAARALGADFAYVGSAWIATEEANAPDEYKQAICDGLADDIVYSNLFTGVHGNYLRRSIINAGLDPDNLPDSDASNMNFGSGGNMEAKAWRDIWGAGQGIGAIRNVQTVESRVAQFHGEYVRARLAT